MGTDGTGGTGTDGTDETGTSIGTDGTVHPWALMELVCQRSTDRLEQSTDRLRQNGDRMWWDAEGHQNQIRK